MSLSEDVRKIRDSIHSTGLQHLMPKLGLEDSTVACDMICNGKTLHLTIVYLSLSKYPSSCTALSMCENDAKTNDILSELNEEFEESAPLLHVLRTICSTLKANELTDALQEPEEEDNSEVDRDSNYGGSDEEDMESSDGGGQEGWDMAEDSSVDHQEVFTKMSQWARLEETRAAAEVAEDKGKAESSSGLSREQETAQARQIFNIKEAFSMLSRELADILKSQGEEGVAVHADAVGHDVYEWIVTLRGFADCKLAEDLKALQRRHGYNDVVLRVSFKRGLHPFYPPAVQLLRPRFVGPLHAALSAHPLLRLANWDPWRLQRDLMLQLKAFIEAVGRVDVEAPGNMMTAFDSSAYTEVELQLARLEALSEVLPLCLPEAREIYEARDVVVEAERLQALAPESKRAKKDGDAGEKPEQHHWAKGTGYGHRGLEKAEVWDSTKTEQAQAARDAELQLVLERLAAALGHGHGDAGEPAGPDPSEWRAVEASCLLPFLETELQRASFTDMAKRVPYYTAMLQVAGRLCLPEGAALLHRPAAGASSLAALLEGLDGAARRFLAVVTSAAAAAPKGRQAAGGRGSAAAAQPGPSSGASADAETDEERQAVELAGVIRSVAAAARKVERPAVPDAGPAARTRRQQAAGAGPSGSVAAGASADDLEKEYAAQMKGFKVDMVTAFKPEHAFRGQQTKEASHPRPRMVRVGKEMAALGPDLPLSRGSSVFVRVDESAVVLWRALITGPTGTPYSGGAFAFDIYFPPLYPTVAPQLQLRTTGGGSVRFNPNLYNCGKVCLSLLGTWSGANGETWSSQHSSTLQVLVSIQSLIFVDEPYFNEPGFEGSMHTESGRKQSADYNANIRAQTMRWAIQEQLQHPPPEFADALRTHFRLQRDTLAATCRQWLAEARSSGHKREAGLMEACLAKIEPLLAAL